MGSKSKKKKKSGWREVSRQPEVSERRQQLLDELDAMPKTRSTLEGFTKWRMITYAWVIFLPPYGLYRIWSEESTFVRSEKVVWTFMIIVYMLQFLKLILFP